MARKSLYEFPDFMDPAVATADDWIFFRKNLWCVDVGIASLVVEWSNSNFDHRTGHYIGYLIVNKDIANPVEEIRTRDVSELNSWVYSRIVILTDGQSL